VDPDDVQDPKLRAALFAPGGVPLHDPSLRPQQLFSPNGLLRRLGEAVPNTTEADKIAAQIARHALRNHPWEFFLGGLDTWGRYLDRDVVRQRTLVELAIRRPYPPALVAQLKDYHYDDRPPEGRLTRVPRLIIAVEPWIMIIAALALPLAAALGGLALVRREVGAFVIALNLAISMAINLWLAPVANMRYLHPTECLWLLAAACLGSLLLRGRERAGTVDPGGSGIGP
jgi:hypothetical protein